jgi:hypothetical protein
MSSILSRLKRNYLEYLVLALLVVVSIAWRKVVWDAHNPTLANIELITTSTIIASLFLRSKLRWLLPLVIVALSDTIIPNSRTTALYVWSAWALVGVVSYVVATMIKKKTAHRVSTNTSKLVPASLVVLMITLSLFASRFFSPVGKLINPFALIILAVVAACSIIALIRRGSITIASALGLGIGSTLLFYFVTNFGVWLEGWYPQTTAGLIDCYIKALPFLERQLRTNIVAPTLTVAAVEYSLQTIKQWAAHRSLNHYRKESA